MFKTLFGQILDKVSPLLIPASGHTGTDYIPGKWMLKLKNNAIYVKCNKAEYVQRRRNKIWQNTFGAVLLLVSRSTPPTRVRIPLKSTYF